MTIWTWTAFPEPCTTNFTVNFYAAADSWLANLQAIDAEILAARGGLASTDARFDAVEGVASGAASEISAARGGLVDLDARLDQYDTVKSEVEAARATEVNVDARLDAIEAGTRIASGAITLAKTDYSGTAADGYVKVYRTAAGKEVFEDITAVVGSDTYQVKLTGSGDTANYLGSLLGFGLNVSAGVLKKTNQVEWTTVSTTHTAADGDALVVAGGATVTLPATPTAGNTVRFAPGGDWEASNATVARNGEKIMGSAEDLTLNKNAGFSLVYKDSTDGWRIA